MSRAAAWALALGVVLLLWQAILPEPGREQTASSFGTGPTGHKALHDLLRERRQGGARHLGSIESLPETSAVWWIEPRGVCDQPDRDWRGAAWVSAGGTALVYLPSFTGELPPGRDHWLPETRDLTPEEKARIEELLEAQDAEDAADLEDEGEDPELADVDDEEWLEPEATGLYGEPIALDPDMECGGIAGALLPERKIVDNAPIEGDPATPPRVVAPRFLTVFEDAAEATEAGRTPPSGWKTVLQVGRHPFALERPHGEGRIVVVADASFLHNRHLGVADGAPLALDQARRFGSPVLDERSHGFVPEGAPLRYLARSAAAPVAVGIVAAFGLWAWGGRRWPLRGISDERPAAPTLETFVASLARLYGESRDVDRIWALTRDLAVDRIRRHYGFPAGQGALPVVERLERAGRTSREAAASLTDETPVESRAELHRRSRALEHWLQEVLR